MSLPRAAPKQAKKAIQVADAAPSRSKTRMRRTFEGASSADASISSRAATKTQKERKVRIGKHTVTLSNEDKIFWPDENIRKGDVINYYNAVSKYILPYLKDRPQSLRRNPHGIRDRGFFHKDAGGDAPEWVDTVTIWSDSAHKEIEYIVCNNRATLLYLNNLGCIELNPWNSRVTKPDHPDYMVIDLDPSDNNSFEQVIDAAQVVHEILEEAGAPSFCKTSGASGLHIYVPLKSRYHYDDIRTFAGIIASLAEQQLPETTTTERPLSKRNGRIYLDYLQNKKGQTLASVYSVRPKPGATVSMPVSWKEVKHGLHPSMFTIHNTEERLNKVGDLFKGVLAGGIDLRKCLRNLKV